MKELLKSSYAINNFNNIIKSLTFCKNPSLIVEFGILEGYSLNAFIESVNKTCQIHAYDLFDEFPYNAAIYENIMLNFNKSNIKIEKLDFYQGYKKYDDETIDILHIDIANDGETYEFTFQNYMNKLSLDGICLLEGGSEERDNIEWMKKYNKVKIQTILKKYDKIYDILNLQEYPSLTIIKKKQNIWKHMD